MTKLQTKSGLSLFTAMVTVSNIELVKEGDKVIALLNGEQLGEVSGETVVADGKKVKITSLKSSIDVAALIGKDPTSLSHEELVALTLHLQQIATDKVGDASEEKEATPKANKKKAVAETKAKPKAKAKVVEEEDEDEEEEELDEHNLPEGIETYDDLAVLGSKELWKDIVKPIVSELEGITSRSKKDEMLEAVAKYFGLAAPEEEEEDEEEEDDLPASFANEDEDEDEDDDLEDEEDDDEDDSDDEDEEDDEDEDSDDDDEDDEEEEDDEEYDEEDEDDEDEEEEVTPEDVDALFEQGNKKAILEFCKLHQISIPKKKLSADKVKQIIMEALFEDQ